MWSSRTQEGYSGVLDRASGRGEPKEEAQAHRDSEAKGKSLDLRAGGLLRGTGVPSTGQRASKQPSVLTIFLPAR